MDSVAIPPEGADIYIPTISGAESSASSQQQEMVPAIVSYTPALGAPPLVAARRTFVADAIQGGPIPLGIQYRTTFCTQVQFAQTTFHYPPTPPVELTESDKTVPGETPHLPVQHSAMDTDGHLEKAANPFPSLPTPPDLEAISVATDHCPASATSPPNSSCVDVAKHSPVIANSWPAQNICFMSQQTAPMLPFGAATNSIAARRLVPQPPALYYPVPEKKTSPKKIPPLVKDYSMSECDGDSWLSGK